MSPKTQHPFATSDPSEGCRERWGCAGVEEGKEELPQCPRGQDLTLFHNLAVLLLTSRSADAHVEEHISRNDNYKKEIKKKKRTNSDVSCRCVFYNSPSSLSGMHQALLGAIPLPTLWTLPNQSSY